MNQEKWKWYWIQHPDGSPSLLCWEWVTKQGGCTILKSHQEFITIEECERDAQCYRACEEPTSSTELVIYHTTLRHTPSKDITFCWMWLSNQNGSVLFRSTHVFPSRTLCERDAERYRPHAQCGQESGRLFVYSVKPVAPEFLCGLYFSPKTHEKVWKRTTNEINIATYFSSIPLTGGLTRDLSTYHLGHGWTDCTPAWSQGPQITTKWMEIKLTNEQFRQTIIT
jgi:hypothetical protein